MTLLVYPNQTLVYQGKTYPCQYGAKGITAAESKQEGDLKTPAGTYPLRQLFYRSDRLKLHQDVLKTALSPKDGWCDDPLDPLYNQWIQTPYAGRHEDLFRKDNVYDLIWVLGYNDDPVVPYKGSAIFLHLSREDLGPTAGCIALRQKDFLEILQGPRPSQITIHLS